MMDKEETIRIFDAEPEEYNALAKSAEEGGDGIYTHKFRKPFTYMGKTYTELHFDWDCLTGNDSLNIEEEVFVKTGRTVIRCAFSNYYLMYSAARCCTEKIGSDAIGLMREKDKITITEERQSFLTRRESPLETADHGSGSNA